MTYDHKVIDINEYIKMHKLQEVNDGKFMDDDKEPTEGGLFSYKIFGTPGSKDRMNKWAWINLGAKIINPA